MSTAILIVFWLGFAILAYAHVVYPLLFAGLIRRAKSVASPETDRPTVTLVIPAHNEAAILRMKLDNAAAIDYPNEKLQVLVVDDGSTDETATIARGYQRSGVEVIVSAQRRGKAVAIADAVAHATGDVLCLCDANVLFEPDALGLLVGRLMEPEVGAVSGDVRLTHELSDLGCGESVYYRCERRLQVVESQRASMMGVDGGMYVLRKELFRPLPADTILDDFVISMQVIRQGYRVVYEPRAVAHEKATPNARQEWRRRVRVAAGAMQSIMRGQWPPIRRPVELWQYVSHKLLRWMTPFVLVVLAVSNIMLVSDGWFYQVSLAAQGVLYLIAACGALCVPLRATPIGGIPFYFVMSNVAMALGLAKGLFNLQPVTWQQADRIGSKQQEKLAVGKEAGQ